MSSIVIGNVPFDKSIINEPVSIPFKSKGALKQLQDEDEDLKSVKHYLLSGKQPGVNDNTKNDIKRYLSAGTKISKDGVLYVNKITNKLVSYDRIIIPRSFGYGFLLAMHYNLDCPTVHQLERNFSRAFFTLDLNKIIKHISDNCTKCISLKKIPKMIDCFTPNDVPKGPGFNFTIDVLKIDKKLVMVSVENFSGFVITAFVASESAADLETGIFSTILPFKSGNSTHIRVDQAPGFAKLHKSSKQSNLQSVGIQISLGEQKNKNAVAIVDQKIKELEEELRKDTRVLDTLKLQKATIRVNEKIRKENLSSKEILFRRNQYTLEELDISDKTIADKKSKDRIENNIYSAKSKADVKKNTPIPDTSLGKLVFLKNDISKHSPREVYVITDTPDSSDFIFIQKMLHVLSQPVIK